MIAWERASSKATAPVKPSSGSAWLKENQFSVLGSQFSVGSKASLIEEIIWRNAMQLAITAIAVVAGLVFSLAIALLVEELIFGKVFRVLFIRQAVRVKSGQER
jgi:hypothetical protein